MALTGLKVVEFAGLAPGPFAGLVLADNGASVTRVDKPGAQTSDLLSRGKRSISIDARVPAGCAVLKKLISEADVVIDPFRPGVMEKLGLGPEVFLGAGETRGLNEKLVYARIVGFPRTGPHRNMAGHDINYLALSGLLPLLPGSPVPKFPLNLLADFGGGGLFCAIGILLALLERTRSKRGQIVDADMVTGTRYLASFPLLHKYLQTSFFSAPHGENPLDGGAPYYGVYACADSPQRLMSVGALEPHFFAAFLALFVREVGPDESGWVPVPEMQEDRVHWGRLRTYLENGFRTQTRDFWTGIFHGSDCCVVPVLTPDEAIEASASSSPTMHSLLSRTPPRAVAEGPEVVHPGADTYEILAELGISQDERHRLAADRVIAQPHENPVNAKL